MTTVILFVFGVIVGSFLNVVGTRYNSGLTLRGRSFCPKCGHQLSWFELVPVLSYLAQQGRCRRCRARISPQYPIVELSTGLLFASLYSAMGLTIYYLLSTAVFCIYITIAIYDLRHKIIPDALVYSAIILSLVFGALKFIWNLEFGIWDLAAGPILFAFFALLWLITRGRAIGFGDAKLVLSIGLLLGAAQGFSAVILAFWIGAALGVVLMIFGRRRITMKSEIPFAPILILGAWLALILNLDLLHVSLL